MQTIVASILILVGAVVMLGSILRSRELIKVAPLISKHSRRPILRLLGINRYLMMFFLLGYVVVALAFLFDVRPIGELSVSVIFLFGAAFVLMGIWIQARMLLEIQSTIHGILPMCTRCKKIRAREADPENRGSWKTIETYIKEDTTADFAQGFCPDCLDQLYGLGAYGNQAKSGNE